MTVSLLHPLIAVAAAAAIAVPILIHLLLRQKPKPVVFPAMVLLRKRHHQTIRRLRVRHWLLLALRCLLLLLLGLALARPTLRSSLLAIDQEAPIGASFVFDDSPSMEMKERGATRLERAKELALESIRRMPAGSRISIIEASNPVSAAPLERAGAMDRIERIQTQSIPRPVNEAVAAAIRGAAQLNEDRRELYVFSDQASNAWNLAEAGGLAKLLEGMEPPISLFVIDVHAEKLDNVSIDDVRLSSQVLASKTDLTLDVSVRNRGAAAENAVRLVIDGKPRGEKPVRLAPGQAATVPFQVPGLAEGFHQGEVLLATNDAMPFDDRRYFTVDVQPAVRVLVVADEPSESLYWRKALVPDVDRQEQKVGYQIDRIASPQIEQTSLEKYAVVALLDAGPISQSGWLKLAEFVRQGGGLFVALGPRVDEAGYNSIAAQQVLPGRLKEIQKAADVALVADRLTHPVLERFAKLGSTDLADWAVLTYWKVEPAAGQSSVILPYTNGDAGLVERSFGEGKRGRAILLTTAAHYQQNGEPWSELPLGWSYVVLADEITRYLAGTAEVKLNFLTGETVVIPRRASDAFAVYAVTDPSGGVERISVDPRASEVSIPAVPSAGNYKVDASQADRTFSAGYSANIASAESSIEPITADKMEQLFGKKHVAVARDPAELQRVEGAARVGRELFPWIMAAFAIAVAVEGVLSNRFYRQAAAVGGR